MAIINKSLFVRMIFTVISLCLLIFIAVYGGYRWKHPSREEAPPVEPPTPEPTWCTIRPGTPLVVVIENINFACNYVDCSCIQVGGTCYLPSDPLNYASIVMNLYYQSKGSNEWNCNFGGTGIISSTDPSYGECVFPSVKKG